MCLTSATLSHHWDSYRELVLSLFRQRPRFSLDSSTLVSIFWEPIQFHVPYDFRVALVKVFEIPSVSCFHVYTIFDVVYCTSDILTLSHWVCLVVYTSRFSRASFVVILHSMRIPLLLCTSYSFQFMYSTSHWGHHYILPVLSMYWSAALIWALIPIFILRHFYEHGYALLVHIHVWDYMYLIHFLE